VTLSSQPRTPVTRERVIAAAITLADRDGLHALTMRALAEELGIKPMSLYHHLPNKDAVLDGIVDAVFTEIPLPRIGGDWQAELAARARAMRAALRRHPWAIGLLESRRTPGGATLRHHDAVLGTLRAGGLSVPMAAHAYAVLDAFVYGFAVQETSMPIPQDGVSEAATAALSALPADALPHLVELVREHVSQPGYDFGAEFEYGLGLVLDGLAGRARQPL
jgi:AcrR family transcriptional regulator